MEVELTDLGFEPHLEPPAGTGNARNGTTSKTLITRARACSTRRAEEPQRDV